MILRCTFAEGALAREAARQQAAKEQAEREAAAKVASQPVTTTTSSPPAAVTSGGVSLAATTVTVQSSGMALVRLNCLGIASCRGKLTLTAKSSVEATGKKKARAIMIGTVRFVISGDKAKTIKFDLNAAGRTLLGADHGRCSASLAILELAPGPENTQTKAVHLVQRKTTKRRNRCADCYLVDRGYTHGVRALWRWFLSWCVPWLWF